MIVVALVWNVAMMVVYKLKIPFFEQYRVNPDVIDIKFRNFGLGNKIIKSGYHF